MRTPWGESQTVMELAPGITAVTTAGHGGIHLSLDRVREMPACLKRVPRCGSYTASWFEEDCEASLVALAFRHLDCFSPHYKNARDAVLRYYPEAFAKWKDSLPRTCPTCRGSVAVRLNHDPEVPGVCGDPYHGLGVSWAKPQSEVRP